MKKKSLQRSEEERSDPALLEAQPLVDHQGLAVVKGLCAMAVRIRRDPRSSLVGSPQRTRGGPGLMEDEMRIMAAISRRQLRAGQSDLACELFNLQASCTRPLADWFPGINQIDEGLADLVVIDSQTGLATQEAIELAAGFGGLDAEHQQGAFETIRAELDKRPKTIADLEYTKLREFVVRHPVCDRAAIQKTLSDMAMPAALSAVVYRDIYETAPLAWSRGDSVAVCGYCGNALLLDRGRTRRCRTQSCHYARPLKMGTPVAGGDLMCVSAPFHLYWIEPGVDEIRLYDALMANGHRPSLYPYRDRVDISLGEIGIDLKDYSSPVLLGRKLRQSIGGLAQYREKWLVIPDRRCRGGDDYRSRLIEELGTTARRLTVLSVSESIERAGHA